MLNPLFKIHGFLFMFFLLHCTFAASPPGNVVRRTTNLRDETDNQFATHVGNALETRMTRSNATHAFGLTENNMFSSHWAFPPHIVKV